MKSKWLLYTESPHYHNGRYIMILEEIKFINNEWRWFHHCKKYHNIKYNIIKDINKPPFGYILSIIFDNFNSALKYKEYIENKYYNKINKSIDDCEKYLENIKKEFENEFRFGSKKEMRQLKLKQLTDESR